MRGNDHEIRDPIHVFVRLDSDERKVLDSAPFQRLRHIHQLALTHLVYPGATHKRFEHSLGVMELAGRVFDVVTHPNHLTDEIRDLLAPVTKSKDLSYWKQVLRMAALCHDVGHLPFSHASEELLPEGYDHETITRHIVRSAEMKAIWEAMTPPLLHQHIEKLAVGPKKATELAFSDWETILSEIIVGDAFGVDRMDYLLRDSYHAGVAYGRFDHYRLVDTLRILPRSPADESESSREPSLGVEIGGIQSAEAMMLARYLMYSQVYFHPVRRVYDIHLTDFLRDWLKGGVFPIDVGSFLRMSDIEVTAALRGAVRDRGEFSHHADPIMRREHFRRLYTGNPVDRSVNPEAGRAIHLALGLEFSREDFRHDHYTQRGGALDFPVLMDDDRIMSSLALSSMLRQIPIISVDYVFVERSMEDVAKQWLEENLQSIIESFEGDGADG